MTKEQAASRIVEIGIVPVVRASSAEYAIQAAEAVCRGGIPIVEMTMTVPGAIEAISHLVKSAGAGVLIGAGTVLDAETAQRCVDAGAEFIVSPGFDLETVTLVKRLGKLMIAGALTPTEVILAWKTGSDFVKIFPCGAVGGAKYIKAPIQVRKKARPTHDELDALRVNSNRSRGDRSHEVQSVWCAYTCHVVPAGTSGQRSISAKRDHEPSG